MSDTPRTDAECQRGDYKNKKTAISPEFARQLERELNAALRELRDFKLCGMGQSEIIVNERDQLRADKERLDWLESSGRVTRFSDGWNVWARGTQATYLHASSLRAAIDAAMQGGNKP